MSRLTRQLRLPSLTSGFSGLAGTSSLRDPSRPKLGLRGKRRAVDDGISTDEASGEWTWVRATRAPQDGRSRARRPSVIFAASWGRHADPGGASEVGRYVKVCPPVAPGGSGGTSRVH
jgi:hypothetical protein